MDLTKLMVLMLAAGVRVALAGISLPNTAPQQSAMQAFTDLLGADSPQLLTFKEEVKKFREELVRLDAKGLFETRQAMTTPTAECGEYIIASTAAVPESRITPVDVEWTLDDLDGEDSNFVDQLVVHALGVERNHKHGHFFHSEKDGHDTSGRDKDGRSDMSNMVLGLRVGFTGFRDAIETIERDGRLLGRLTRRHSSEASRDRLVASVRDTVKEIVDSLQVNDYGSQSWAAKPEDLWSFSGEPSASADLSALISVLNEVERQELHDSAASISPLVALRGLEQTAYRTNFVSPRLTKYEEIAVWAWPAILGRYVEERGYTEDQWYLFQKASDGVLAPGFLKRFFGDRLADKLRGQTVSLVGRLEGEEFRKFVGDKGEERTAAIEGFSEDIVDLLLGHQQLNFLESIFLLARRVMYRHVLPNGNGRFATIIRNALLMAFGYRPARLLDPMSHYRGFFDTAVVSDEETLQYIESYFSTEAVGENRVVMRLREIARMFSFDREETGQLWLRETLDLLKSPAATIVGPFSVGDDASVFEWKSPEAVGRMISGREPEEHAQSSTDANEILVLRVGAFTAKELSDLLLPRSKGEAGARTTVGAVAEARVRTLSEEAALELRIHSQCVKEEYLEKQIAKVKRQILDLEQAIVVQQTANEVEQQRKKLECMEPELRDLRDSRQSDGFLRAERKKRHQADGLLGLLDQGELFAEGQDRIVLVGTLLSESERVPELFAIFSKDAVFSSEDMLAQAQE